MTEVLVFAGKALILFTFTAALILLIALLVLRSQQMADLEITPLHEKWKEVALLLKSFLFSREELKAEQKKLKKEQKEQKERDRHLDQQHKVFVLRFKGDLKAHETLNLREEVNAVLQVAQSKDEVVVVLESPGGVVSGYGLAASQLLRLRERNIPLTVCVDEVAASGGYLMACVANKILAAPFAIIGSIGVVAQVPNFFRFLKKWDVDYREYTAGEFKRTVSLFGEITPKGEEKFLEQLEETHDLFKNFVKKYRPQIDLTKVATGEYWYGENAIDRGLIDVIKTSDDYLLEKAGAQHLIFEIKYEHKIPLVERVSEFLGRLMVSTGRRLQQEIKSEPPPRIL
ncbi:MAG: protease SohB [Bdellovibrio sp.]|nr:MAG: protease SohB [Bdellovibrio sp.]